MKENLSLISETIQSSLAYIDAPSIVHSQDLLHLVYTLGFLKNAGRLDTVKYII